MPVRVQLSRAAGWRMPPGTLKVDRSTRWGNPFIPGIHGDLDRCLADFADLAATWDLSPLAGRDLACWCKPGSPCHADILLQLANPSATTTPPVLADPSAYYRAGLRDLLSASLLHALHQAGNAGLTVELALGSIRADHAAALAAFHRLVLAGLATPPARQTGRGRPYSWTITPAGTAVVTAPPLVVSHLQPLLSIS